jgi:hypothetical protein
MTGEWRRPRGGLGLMSDGHADSTVRAAEGRAPHRPGARVD